MQTNNSILIFSVFSGTYFYVPENDAKNMKIGNIPLNKKPRTNCKKCAGRGYQGINTQNLARVICKCLQKEINFDILKLIENKHVSKQFPGK